MHEKCRVVTKDMKTNSTELKTKFVLWRTVDEYHASNSICKYNYNKWSNPFKQKIEKSHVQGIPFSHVNLTKLEVKRENILIFLLFLLSSAGICFFMMPNSWWKKRR